MHVVSLRRCEGRDLSGTKSILRNLKNRGLKIMFTNPLDSIRIASPCKADWNEMYGDGRRRFCGECKMNVYNLSGMTRQEAESLLTNSEGRLCVRFFRRKDGTVLTKDCPVGWQALKRKASRFAVAFSSLLAGVLAGAISFLLRKFTS